MTEYWALAAACYGAVTVLLLEQAECTMEVSMRLIKEWCARPLQFLVWQCGRVHSPDSNTYSVAQSAISKTTATMSSFGPPQPPLSFPFRWIHDDGGEEGEIRLILS